MSILRLYHFLNNVFRSFVSAIKTAVHTCFIAIMSWRLCTLECKTTSVVAKTINAKRCEINLVDFFKSTVQTFSERAWAQLYGFNSTSVQCNIKLHTYVIPRKKSPCSPILAQCLPVRHNNNNSLL